jgi:tetratricopeptide (TPR) repeat protein
MKRAILIAIVVAVALGGVAYGQSESDQVYIKAMTANTPAERMTLLKDFVAKFGGKGVQYENFATANLCIMGWQGKTEQETISYGEKALSLGGLDNVLKCQVLMNVAALFAKQGQVDKAKSYSSQLIQTATDAKAKEPGAANWDGMIGAGHYLTAQALDKAKDVKGALDEYMTAYGILKDPKTQATILAEIKKQAKSFYEAKNYADAEKVFRTLAQANPRDAESLTFVALCLYKGGKVDEAMAMWKDAFAKSKSGDVAYNIGITLAREAKTNPALTNDAIKYLIDAAFLSPAKSKEARALAESLYFSSDKEWNNRVKLMHESKALIDDWAKTINTKFGDKSEDDLTPDQKREYRKIKESIDKEQKILDDLNAKQKAGVEGFNRILEGEKQKLGIK